GGAGGVELAMALQHRLDGRARVSLVTGGPPPLGAYPPPVQSRGRPALRRCGVTVFEDSCTRIDAGHVLLREHGRRLACEAAAAAVGWGRGAAGGPRDAGYGGGRTAWSGASCAAFAT